jgi:hypothetical protein
VTGVPETTSYSFSGFFNKAEDGTYYQETEGGIPYEILEDGSVGIKLAERLSNDRMISFNEGDEGDGLIYIAATSEKQTENTEVTTPPSAWAQSSVDSAVALGLATADLTNGYQATTTRAEFCRAAINFLRKYGYNVDSVTAKTFADTSDKDIGIAAALGITSGTDAAKNLFSPDNPLTREQAATMLCNVLKVIGVSYESVPVAWTDKTEVSGWATEGVDVMYNAKIMGGTSADELVFSPQSPYTHEQSIITLVNLWNYIKK